MAQTQKIDKLLLDKLLNAACGACVGLYVGIFMGLVSWLIWGKYMGGIVMGLSGMIALILGFIVGFYYPQQTLTSLNKNPDLAKSAQDIRVLLEELSQKYNPNTEKGQEFIRDEAIEAIEHNPTLKTHVINALQSAGDTALEGAIGHPIAKIVITAAKGFVQQ
jgi:uncharacterized protein YneF (UPF0154 family)